VSALFLGLELCTVLAAALRACRASPFFIAAACAPREHIERIAGPTMGTTYEVKWVACGNTTPSRAAVQAEVEHLLARVNSAFSTWDEQSVVSRFNAHANTEPFTIPAEHRDAVIAVTRLALEVAARTGGAFDPTIQPIVELFGFGRSEGEAPSASERAAALARIGWHKLHVGEDGTLRKEQADLQITFSALVPGWTADRIADRLAQLGAGDCMVDVGGEIACRGQKSAAQGWVIGIEKPALPGATSTVHSMLPLVGGLATSGVYRNFKEVGDDVMHHILDPKTGANVQHAWLSVAVRADSAALADALATAFLVLGPDGALPVVDGYEGRVAALFLGPPGEDGRVTERRLRW
jgi:thiamine biosynthesis lipoprotein